MSEEARKSDLRPISTPRAKSSAEAAAPGKTNFRAPITFARHHPAMSDATATPELRPHASLFTRLRVVETELQTLKALFADLKEDHDALRADRDEWRWRAEYLLAEAQRGFLDRWGRRIVQSAKALERDVFRFVGSRRF